MHEGSAFANAAGVREKRIVELSELNATVKGLFQGLRDVFLGKRPMPSQKTETDGREGQNDDARVRNPAGQASSFPGKLFSVGSFQNRCVTRGHLVGKARR